MHDAEYAWELNSTEAMARIRHLEGYKQKVMQTVRTWCPYCSEHKGLVLRERFCVLQAVLT